MSQIKIIFDDQTLVGNTHQPLLEQLENAGFQPEYQCRNGFCGACRCQLKAGTAQMNETIAFIHKDEILPCQAIPQSDLEINFEYPLTNRQHKPF